MHIKQVVVCGFRSYKDQIVVEPFSKEHNVVIGRNGTGKSNFFDAIRFGLLTSRFANLRQDERQALLHEGSGKHVMSAYVEIVFDNRDGRLPVDTEDVVLRRTIGVKKDEFFLNRKHITKSDVIHLLESAGFSRSNPYYIVQQGKVNSLALMKEAERLDLLKEVAGTKVYEDRRIESLKILHETESRREKIQDVIFYIEQRLGELEEEKEELKEYQQLDRERRALEYTLHEKQLQTVRLELESIERQRIEESTASSYLHEKHIQVRQNINEAEEKKNCKKDELLSLVDHKRDLDSERNELIENRSLLELEVRELKEKISSDEQRKAKLIQKQLDVENAISEKQSELDVKVLPRCKTAEFAHKEVVKRLEEAEYFSESLIAKQSRRSQFKTEEDRDSYLKREIRDLERLIHRKKDDTTALQTSLELLKDDIQRTEAEVEDQNEILVQNRSTVESLGLQVLELKAKRNSLSDVRKNKWRAENEVTFTIRKLSDQLARNENTLQGTMPLEVRRGLQAIREMSERGRFNGIYGPLIELIEPVDERFCTAVDEAAGGSLFHVVVDTDDTAADIMKELDKKNMGRITFLPLNRLKIKDNISYPKSEDVMPLIDKLRFPSEVRRSIIATFGKKLLCKDLETCAQYAERTKMDCLTLDGDMVHRRGALNGGFKDPQKSRIKAMIEVRRVQIDLANMQSRAAKLKHETQQADQRVAAVVGKIQKLEAEKQHALQVYECLSEELARLRQHLVELKDSLLKKEQNIVSQYEEIQSLETRADRFRIELSTKMQDALSSEETYHLHSLTMQISQLRGEEKRLRAELEEALSVKKTIYTLLQENLFRRKNEISTQLQANSFDDLTSSEMAETLKVKEMELCNTSSTLESNSATLERLDTNIRLFEKEISLLQSKIEDLHVESSELNEKIEFEAHRGEKILNRRRRLLQKREDTMRDIRELGSLPLSELEHFKSLSIGEVIKKFNSRNEKLKKYSHVNKKALDQYVSFSEQRSVLFDRKRELDEGYESIKDLVDVLDKRKDEAILRTFKGVSHHFAEVFRELVPTGQGKMVIIRADEAQSGGSYDQVSPTSKVDTFSGIQIQVSFRGEGDSYLMHQLSGGQKALVALAFIFAIQRCDPAPFYLFDEIDQALDSTHRAAVAALIYRQAHSKENSAQVSCCCCNITLHTINREIRSSLPQPSVLSLSV
jgi:structural maintenance of chromosome 3 (chondroitin sulfate proteoglycan 6)